MSDINNSETSKLINQIYFELHGGDKIKQISKDINDALKQIRKEADLANQSADKVIKKFTTLGQMSPQMSNISSAIYSKQEKRRITNISRTTHSTEKYKDYYSEGTVDYNAARLAWKQQEAEKKKQVKLNQEITNFLKEYEAFESKLVDLKKKEVQTAEKIRKMTEYQQNKINVARERNIINTERNAIRERERLDRRNKNDRLAGYQNYKSEHPELFTVGGLLHSKRYQAGRALSGVGSAVSSLGLGGKFFGGLFDALGTLVKSPIAGAATAVSNLARGVIDLGKSATQAFAEIEAIKTQLGVVFSNQTQAESVFGQISQYAVKSPFGVQQTSELAVLLKQSGVYASDLMDTLKMLGDTAGGNMEKMKRIANNYAQIVSIGKASMLDMRQFAYAGIPIFEAVSKELGVSQQELRKLISDGKVTSDIIEKVFKDLTGINGIFENATEKGAKTLKARLQNLSDARQLAFGSIGEWGTKLGTNTGGDSYVNKMVAWAENLYSYIKEHVNTINIQKDVATLANRTDRIEILKKLIEDNKDNKELRVTYEKELQAELSKRDVDLERLTYANSYDAKRGRLIRAQEALSGYSLDNAVMRFSALSLLSGPAQGRDAAKLNPYSKEYEGLNQRELENLASLFKELVDAINAEKTITEEDAKAHRESAAIDAQQLAFDRENSRADKSDSLNSKFQELLELYKSSDEYKAKEEEKRIKTLNEAKEILKQLVPKVGQNGVVDFSKFTMPEFLRYDAQGAFSSGKKFNIVNGNRPTNKEDMALLREQFTYAMNEAYKQASFYMDNRTALKLQTEITELNSNLNDEDYLNKFSETLTNVQNLLKTSQLPDNIKSQVLGYLVSSTVSHELTTGGENANPNDISKGSNYDFIPLWKRILSNATGLSTQGMTSTLQTLSNYRDDMAIRNMTSNVLTATMKTMGLDTAMGLVKTAGNAKQLRGDTGGTYQVDWQSTRKAIKEFALSLSASTDVITAYKNSLEQELDVYEQLIAAGYTEAESQDLKNQKTVSTKTLEKLSMDAGDQLVNAFGEGLKTASGKTAYFQNGEFVDEKGNKLQEEEIIITGNLFEFIKAELPRLRKEISEAAVSETNKKMFDTALANTLKTQLGYRATNNSTTRSGVVSGFLLDNPDYLVEQFNNIFPMVLDEFKDIARYKDLIKDGSSNIISTAMIATPEFLEEQKSKGFSTDRYEAANELVQKALELVTSATERLGVGSSGSAYQRLTDNELKSEFNKIIQERFRYLMGTGTAQQLSLQAYEDQGGIGGSRGVTARALNNFFGLDRGYDLQSLYAYGKLSGGDLKVSDFIKNKYGLSTNEVSWEGGAELSTQMNEIVEAAIRYNEAMKDTQEVTRAMAADLQSAFSVYAKGAWEKPFEKMAENLVLGKDASEGMEDAYKNLAGELLKASSQAMVKAGWELVARGAADKNYGMIAGGLGLVAAGGVAAGLGSALTQTEDKDKSNKEAEKLEALKSDLQKLLEQARTDALYYENNLRHQTALGINKEFSYKSVHDAILTPKGDVVTTDPRDYLIATKTPQSLVGGNNVTVKPVINCNVINNTSAKVSQEQSVNADGSIDIVTMIEEVTGGYIASSRSDDAFASREYRMRGKQSIM